MILTGAKNAAGVSMSDQLAHFFISTTTQSTFPVVVGIYSAFLGLFVPSGGGKWILEAPYVMQAANELKVHLGWMVQVYNAAEALPNLINPIFMVPMLGILGMKARDIVGFTFLQFVIHVPVVLFLLWFLAGTLTYTPPVIPPGLDRPPLPKGRGKSRRLLVEQPFDAQCDARLPRRQFRAEYALHLRAIKN